MNKTDTFIPPRNKNDMSSVLKSLIKNKRIGVFIDSANLYYAANKAALKIDYFQISRWFSAHCDLTTLNFYTAFDPLDERQSDFFADLEKSGYTLIKKPIRVFADSVKGNMDIELAVDVLMSTDKFDTLVLISGDGDFQRLIQALDQLKKKTIILGVGGFTSYELHQEADNYFFLNRIQEVWKKPRQRTASAANIMLPSKMAKDNQSEDQSNHQQISKAQVAQSLVGTSRKESKPEQHVNHTPRVPARTKKTKQDITTAERTTSEQSTQNSPRHNKSPQHYSTHTQSSSKHSAQQTKSKQLPPVRLKIKSETNTTSGPQIIIE